MRTYNLINNKRNKKQRQRNAACSAVGYMERGSRSCGFMNWIDLLRNEG